MRTVKRVAAGIFGALIISGILPSVAIAAVDALPPSTAAVIAAAGVVAAIAFLAHKLHEL